MSYFCKNTVAKILRIIWLSQNKPKANKMQMQSTKNISIWLDDQWKWMGKQKQKLVIEKQGNPRIEFFTPSNNFYRSKDYSKFLGERIDHCNETRLHPMTVNNSPSITHLIYLNNIEKMDNHCSKSENNQATTVIFPSCYKIFSSYKKVNILKRLYVKNILPHLLILKTLPHCFNFKSIENRG